MKKPIIAAVIVLVAVAGTAHWYYSDRGRFTTEPVTTGLARDYTDAGLVSTADPAVILQFDPVYEYAGGHKFILYGVADTEQHAFVETAPDGQTKSLYWVQYEAYLPDNDYSYDYEDSPGRMTIGPLEFYVDTDIVVANPSTRRAGSDAAMIRQLLDSKGFEYPLLFAYARLVHLTDDTHRKELMIIMLEDLSKQGFTAAELEDTEANAARRAELDARHLEKIRNTLMVLPLPTAGG
jgi:hypothetical protein